MAISKQDVIFFYMYGNLAAEIGRVVLGFINNFITEIFFIKSLREIFESLFLLTEVNFRGEV